MSLSLVYRKANKKAPNVVFPVTPPPPPPPPKKKKKKKKNKKKKNTKKQTIVCEPIYVELTRLLQIFVPV